MAMSKNTFLALKQLIDIDFDSNKHQTKHLKVFNEVSDTNKEFDPTKSHLKK